SIVPFGDRAALQQALDAALDKDWDRNAILDYARDNQWDRRVAQLLQAFDNIMQPSASQPELAVK
ncbi:MAG: glycosyltransferase family 4 protein, partial [Thiobacillus sp.]|nr:glycosyltransferase family 4 protein [Thiobacillus sp.]